MGKKTLNEQEQRIKAIRKHYEKRAEIISHVVVYIGINIMLWVIYLGRTPDMFPWPLVVNLAWGVGLVIHMTESYFEIQAEKMVLRELGIDVSKHKFKNDAFADAAYVRLSDDGELEPIETTYPDNSNHHQTL